MEQISRKSAALSLALSLTLWAGTVMAQTVPVEAWLRGLAASQKFELVVGKDVGGVMVTPPAVLTPKSIAEVLAKVGVPYGFTTSKDGSRILILQLGIDALSKSVGIPGGASSARSGAPESGDGSFEGKRGQKDEAEESSAEEAPRVVEDPNDPRLQPKPILPPQADPDDPIEAMIDRSILPLPKQIDMSDPDEAQVDPTVKPLPPQIDYNDPDERRTPPPTPGTSTPPKKPAPKPAAPPREAPLPGGQG